MEMQAKIDRSHYPVRKLHMHDPEANDDDLSRTTTMQERLGMMWTLVELAWPFLGVPKHEAESRLQRHVVRIQRRAR